MTHTYTKGSSKGKAHIAGREITILYRFAGAWHVSHVSNLGTTEHFFGSDRVLAFNRFKKYRDGKGF